MTERADPPLWAKQQRSASPLVDAVAYAMVLLVFVADWYSPALVVVGLAYEAPVAFAALKGSRSLIVRVIALGIVGLVLGWFMDLAQASFQFSEERIENRLLSIVSVLLVGSLTLVIESNARRTGRLTSERTLLSRDIALSAAADRVRSSSSSRDTAAAITGEAPRILDASTTVWCPLDDDGSYWIATEDESGAKPLEVERSPKFAALLRRVRSAGQAEIVDSKDSIDFLLGKHVGDSAVAIPIADSSMAYGILIAARSSAPFDEGPILAARGFARFAATAMREAALSKLLRIATTT